MKKSRLLELILTLSNKEIREIRKFLASPYHNRKEEIPLLFEYLVENRSESADVLNKSAVFNKVYGSNLRYDDQRLRLSMSALLKALERFLVQQALFEDEVKVKKKLAEIFRLRNLPRHIDRSHKELDRLQKQTQLRNAKYYQDDYEIQLEKYQIASANRRGAVLNFQKILDNLDIAYLSEKLRQSCLARSHQAIYKTAYEIGMLDEILKYIEENDFLEIPAISAYYYSYQIISNQSAEKYFPVLKDILVNAGDQFPSSELGGLYIMTINFCIKKYNEGDRQFLADEFELYKKGIELNLFMQNNVLSRYTYRNIVTVGLVMEEFQWVEQFIHDFKDKLDRSYRLSTYSLSLARLEYSRKNYDAALSHLQKSNYKETLLNLAAKTVMLKIFYELKEYDILFTHLDAMRNFIRRKKVIGYHQENYLNLIQFTRKLIERNPFDKNEASSLLQEIEATKVVAEKGWLIKRLSPMSV